MGRHILPVIPIFQVGCWHWERGGCYGDLDSQKNKVSRANVGPENVHVDQVGDVEHVAKDESFLTDLK